MVRACSKVKWVSWDGFLRYSGGQGLEAQDGPPLGPKVSWGWLGCCLALRQLWSVLIGCLQALGVVAVMLLSSASVITLGMVSSTGGVLLAVGAWRTEMPSLSRHSWPGTIALLKNLFQDIFKKVN